MRSLLTLITVAAFGIGLWWLLGATQPAIIDDTSFNSTSSNTAVSDSVGWQTYENTRFEYTLEYPDTLTAQPSSQNDDGRMFTDGSDTLLRVFGRHNTNNQTLRNLVNEEVIQLTSMTDARVGSTTAQLVGTVTDGKKRRVKILRTDEQIAIARLTYTKEAISAGQAKHIISSFQWQPFSQ